jgi:hypothetical protein
MKNRDRFIERSFIKISALISFLMIFFHLSLSTAQAYSTEKAGFSLKFKEEISPYKIFSAFVLPDETLDLEILDHYTDSRYEIEVKDGYIREIDSKNWTWKAPDKQGVYPIKIVQTHTKKMMTLNVFVMVPSSEMDGEYIDSYRVGRYSKLPEGFIKITEKNKDTLVSPHFTLSQFVCKQTYNFPQYLILKERLLAKLELILERVNAEGYTCNSFFVMSGYRTPYYNESIGNVKNSRHVFGDAADIYIDEDGDGIMDDLNQDGKNNYLDINILYEIVDEMSQEEKYEKYIGGLGSYKSNSYRGPFIHVDTRGYRARWGYLVL